MFWLLGATTTLVGMFSPSIAYAQTIDPPPPIIQQIDEIACNCYLNVKKQIPNLPLMKDIVPNSMPFVGTVAKFVYTDKNTGLAVNHIAIIIKLTNEGFWVSESNFHHCTYDQRFILWQDPHLTGFFDPEKVSPDAIPSYVSLVD